MPPSGSANSCNRRAGARQGRHHAGASRQQTRSCDGLRRRLEPRDRAEEAAARQQPRRSAAAQCAMCGPGGPVRREGCFQDGSLGSRGTERAACDAAAPSFGTTAKRPLLLRDTRRRDALVAAKATAAAVAARLNVGSAASPQPSRLALPWPGGRAGGARSRGRSAGWARAGAAAPWRRARKGACKGGGDRRGGGARTSRLADVHTSPALGQCWQRSDSTLPTKVF